AAAARGRVPRLALHHRRAEPLEPVETVVEAIDDLPLERRVAARALVPEGRERSVAPDDPAREQHRAARPLALLEDDRLGAELAQPGGRAETGHTGAGDCDQLGEREARLVLDVLE